MDERADIDEGSAVTRTVCRQSYVHPTIPESYRSGQLLDAWRRARRSGHSTRAERMTLAILESGAASDAIGAAA